MAKLLINIPEGSIDCCTEYFGCMTTKLYDILKNSIVIPDKATNLDVLRAVFPNYDYSNGGTVNRVHMRGCLELNDLSKSWCNQTYGTELDDEENEDDK